MEMVISVDEREFGTYLTKIRERAGFKSQRQLALEAGISPATLSRIESGVQRAQPETLKRLAPLLHVQYEELMEKAGYIERHDDESSDSISPEEREFLRWVEENLESSFFYDFDRSPEDAKRHMMDTLRLVWEREKGRRPGQKQGDKHNN